MGIEDIEIVKRDRAEREYRKRHKNLSRDEWLAFLLRESDLETMQEVEELLTALGWKHGTNPIDGKPIVWVPIPGYPGSEQAHDTFDGPRILQDLYMHYRCGRSMKTLLDRCRHHELTLAELVGIIAGHCELTPGQARERAVMLSMPVWCPGDEAAELKPVEFWESFLTWQHDNCRVFLDDARQAARVEAVRLDMACMADLFVRWFPGDKKQDESTTPHEKQRTEEPVATKSTTSRTRGISPLNALIWRVMVALGDEHPTRRVTADEVIMELEDCDDEDILIRALDSRHMLSCSSWT
ncbi:MAG: hypothetical protein HQM06_14415, partial [Magnetococcales bacterium]|nr:hypothetical protein [Magnetococcales bacterium]